MEEGPEQPKKAQKRIKCDEIAEKGDMDGISTFPDCLLLEILTRLPSTKDGIRTGALSKRWAHLWTWVPTLIFELSDLSQCIENPSIMSDFAQSVDKTLTQCRQLKLKKFKVDTLHDIRFESQFNNWISHAISCKVEKLHLDFRCPGREADFLLDQSVFFVNSCFTDLRLKGCILNPSGAISWKSLRSLCISYLLLDEDLIINILSGSPLLETLVLEYYYGYGDPFFDWDDESKINALSSLSLTQCPQLKLKKFELLSFNEIQLQSPLNSWIRYAIRCNVEKIRLSFWSAMGFDFDPPFPLDQIVFTSSCFSDLTLSGCMINPVGPIIWKNLTSLCISNGLVKGDLIEKILSGSPVLETLELDYCYGYSQLDITSKSVKNLVLSGYTNTHDKSAAGDIEINAPDILSLTVQHEMILRNILLVNVSSLIKVNLDYTCTHIWYDGKIMPHETEPERLKDVILKLGHVKEVKIGDLCSEVISCLQAQGFIFPSNVKLSQVT